MCSASRYGVSAGLYEFRQRRERSRSGERAQAQHIQAAAEAVREESASTVARGARPSRCHVRRVRRRARVDVVRGREEDDAQEHLRAVSTQQGRSQGSAARRHGDEALLRVLTERLAWRQSESSRTATAATACNCSSCW